MKTNIGESKYSSSLIAKTHYNETEITKIKRQIDENRRAELLVLTSRINKNIQSNSNSIQSNSNSIRTASNKCMALKNDIQVKLLLIFNQSIG